MGSDAERGCRLLTKNPHYTQNGSLNHDNFRFQLAIAVGIHRDENVPERGRERETRFGLRLLKVDFSEVHDPISFVEKPLHEKVLR